MQFIDWLDDLYQHMKWADAVVWRAALALDQAENDERLRNLLYHIHLTQHAFLRVWSELPLGLPQASHFQNLSAISDWGNEYHERVAFFIGKLQQQAFDQMFVLPWTKQLEHQLGRPAKPTTLGETMVQVAMHSTYHRGQVNSRLRELGGEPPLSDYIAWLWLGRPPADWPGTSKD